MTLYVWNKPNSNSAIVSILAGCGHDLSRNVTVVYSDGNRRLHNTAATTSRPPHHQHHHHTATTVTSISSVYHHHNHPSVNCSRFDQAMMYDSVSSPSTLYGSSGKRYDPAVTTRYESPLSGRYDSSSTVRYNPSPLRYDSASSRFDNSSKRYDSSSHVVAITTGTHKPVVKTLEKDQRGQDGMGRNIIRCDSQDSYGDPVETCLNPSVICKVTSATYKDSPLHSDPYEGPSHESIDNFRQLPDIEDETEIVYMDDISVSNYN